METGPDGMGGQPTSCDLLLSGGSVVTLDEARRVIEPGAVAISGDRIAAVGTLEDLSATRAVRTVDCAGRAVIPGFVDCHDHLFQLMGRGLGEGMSLWPWLCDFMWPFSAAINRDEARIGAALGAIEAVRAGTTAIVDNHYAPADLDTTLDVASAIEEIGIRGAVARGMFGPYSKTAKEHGLADSLFRYSLEEELDITRAAVQARPPGSRVSVWPAPINVIYNEQELVRRAVGLADELGTRWHTHCSEARVDPGIYLEAYGIRPIDWLYEDGLLGSGATIAHGIWLDDREVERIGETSTAVGYNPVSNQYLASGVLRLRDLRRAGAIVGLGYDGGAGHRQDMFEQMKQAVLLQRVHTLDPAVSTAEEVLELATREGARFLGVDAGVLAPGKLADVAVVDLRRAHTRPTHKTVAALAYSARGSDVEMTIVGGDVIYEDGRCTKVEEEAILAEADARADELILRAGLEGLRVPWRR